MKKLMSSNRLNSSFRDPSGFLFTQNGVVYRQVNQTYASEYNHLIESGLYESLIRDGLLIKHEEVKIEAPDLQNASKILMPEQLSFVSYPYEWCFSQLKDAALTTLTVQQRALDYGMSLKDSSGYNIQFLDGKPILIDTLSFAMYQEGLPWDAYRQFCQHFLAPLALMAIVDVRLSQMLRNYVDGIPLDLASQLLPWRTRLNPSLSMHIHIHASAQRRYADKKVEKSSVKRQMSKTQMLGLIDSLKSGVRKLDWHSSGTEWEDYYEKADHYTGEAVKHKREIVSGFLDHIQINRLWDLGANQGDYSRLASEQGIQTVAFDIDPGAVERNYIHVKETGETKLFPLILDLTNPSPSIGWNNQERMSLVERGPTDAVMALALIHHLAIGNNVPLFMIASLLHELGRWLIIEFVPKNDPQVEILLATREDIFFHYDESNFERIFGEKFNIVDSIQVRDTQRRIYLMEKL
jgi:hypothetical protein